MISSMVGIFALLGDPSDLFQSVAGLLQRADGEIVAHSQSIICRACHNFPHEVRYNDLTHRFPLIVETLARLRSRSCIIDCEAVACNNNGVACLPSGTARIEPVVLPSTVARVEGLVGRRDLPGATNAVEAVKPKGLHQVNRPIA
jgi:hypothetical protein